MGSFDPTLRINEKRLWDTLMQSAEIGRTPAGGLQRLSLSDEDRKMRDLFVRWCEEVGCTVAMDRVGNILARFPGRENLPPVAIGSHLDTTMTGGRFDGILGVLGGLEILRTLHNRHITPRRPIDLVDWTNEEGVRFPSYMSGSLVFAGLRPVEWLHSLTDEKGNTFSDALRGIGYAGDLPPNSRTFDAYFELHIEQGPLLYEANIPVGVVIGGAFVRGVTAIFRGQNAHSGGTPMDRRKNALVAAAKFIVSVNDLGLEFAPIGRTTSNWIKVIPNKGGTIPEYSEVMVDMRHQNSDQTDRMYNQALALIVRCAKEAGVEWQIGEEWKFGENIRFDPECIASIRNFAKRLGIPTMDIYSQAGHDAYSISCVAPAAMIFCPCVDGISHNEAEKIIQEQTWPAVNVLLHAVLARADR
jgi:beta-ureidopropionase / N-carbamoyl-L-amino-acid hydrolase